MKKNGYTVEITKYLNRRPWNMISILDALNVKVFRDISKNEHE